MPTTKAKELRTLPAADLQQRLMETHRQLQELRLKAAQGSIEHPHQILQLRRDIARLNTVIHERNH